MLASETRSVVVEEAGLCRLQFQARESSESADRGKSTSGGLSRKIGLSAQALMYVSKEPKINSVEEWECF